MTALGDFDTDINSGATEAERDLAFLFYEAANPDRLAILKAMNYVPPVYVRMARTFIQHDRMAERLKDLLPQGE